MFYNAYYKYIMTCVDHKISFFEIQKLNKNRGKIRLKLVKMEKMLLFLYIYFRFYIDCLFITGL